MFPLLLRKNLFFLPSRSSFSSSLQLRRLLIPFTLRDFSSSSSSSTQPHCMPVEKENIRVSVWWNFNDCRVPPGVSVLKVVPLIIEAVRANGIEGPINNIVAYGDVTQFPKLERKALSAAGVHLCHYNGGKDMINGHLTYHLTSWCIYNPPPVHIFLISSDDRSLHPLRMKNYNMLVAYPGPSSIMCSAATIMWSWSLILKGENLIGKYFNYPPDGPLNSWYGDLKAPIENPDSAVGESTSHKCLGDSRTIPLM